jgi:uncharacterized protein YcbK (DUF882 family)
MTPAHPRPPRRRFLRHTSGLLLAGAALPALANQPETRSLAFSHTHTGEQLALTYAIDAHYLPDSLAAFNLRRCATTTRARSAASTRSSSTCSTSSSSALAKAAPSR